MTRLQADLLVLFAALIWGVAFYFQKTAMLDIGPFLFVSLRSALAAVALVPFALWERSRAPASPETSGTLLLYAAAASAVFCLAAVLQQFGMITATVTNTSFLTALYVVITPFLLWIFGKDRLTARLWVAAATAFLGVWLLGGGTLGGFSTGDMLVAASAIGWSFFMVVIAASSHLARPMQVTCSHFTLTSIACLCGALLFETISWTTVSAALPEILFVGILSSAFTYAAMAQAMRHTQPSHAAVLLSSETLFAAAAGYVLLGERLTPIGWMGASLVLTAIVMIQVARR